MARKSAGSASALVRKRLGEVLGVEVAQCIALGNSSLSENLHVLLADGRGLFVKCQPCECAAVLRAEADGLLWLAEVNSGLHIPTAVTVDPGDGDQPAFMALPFLRPVRRTPALEAALGRGLATMHRTAAPNFGWPRDNYLANVSQTNDSSADWPSFYVERRLQPLVQRVRELRLMSGDACAMLERAFPQIAARVASDEAPAHLHGDLWNGNVLYTKRGPALIDPAVYGGHREVDLAMMALFGGFTAHCLNAYQEVYPFAPGIEERRPLYQLYPLLIHVLLYGGHYVGEVERIAKNLRC